MLPNFAVAQVGSYLGGQTCLLRTQVVSDDHAGLLPVVTAHDTAFADARSHGSVLHDHTFGLCSDEAHWMMRVAAARWQTS
jgi:hypothetical protein